VEQTVTIEKLVHGGRGLARTDKGALFVSDVLPGEKVRAVPDGSSGGQRLAKPIEVIDPSPYRRKPPCVYFGACGGCDWLHCSYELQLSSKADIVMECFERIGKIRDLPKMEIISSPEFGYRQRAQFKIDALKKTMGYYKRKSWKVIPIKTCPLLRPALNTILGQSREILALIPAGADHFKLISGKHASIASSPVLPGITSSTTVVKAHPFSFTVSGNSFFQGNAYLCGKMGAWARESIEGDSFLELYGGVGFFSVFLYDRFRTGVTVEPIESQVALAKRNLTDNGITHISSCAASAEDYLERMRESSCPFDSLIVDPPRTGLSDKVRVGIRKQRPETILYFSCNPSTLARDVGFFVNNGDYGIDNMAMFDLYPNTHHVETAVILKSRGAARYAPVEKSSSTEAQAIV
jgi:23S rRNA (uracil1939-C5)-methyltransferase